MGRPGWQRAAWGRHIKPRTRSGGEEGAELSKRDPS